jgi:hypothetical protein
MMPCNKSGPVLGLEFLPTIFFQGCHGRDSTPTRKLSGDAKASKGMTLATFPSPQP